MLVNEIREKFLQFFEIRGHKRVPSASLLPENDPSVLFTTAGMQQFKSYYLGEKNAKADFGSLNTVSCQKCFRTSDIDEVGDERHLTFFEMLGNFSFGGYGKAEAIAFAHEFITKELNLKIDFVTVFAGDERAPADLESEQIWQRIDQSLEIKKFREDNFWGPTGAEGPCGPTTEIYASGIEIWNLVFNQFYCQADGRLKPLPTLGIDTGMGLERLALAVQGKQNVFETDLFAKFMAVLPASLTEKKKRILADHARAIVFLVSDGVRPSNKGAGYVLRRLLRRLLAQFTFEQIKQAVDWTLANYQESDYSLINQELIFEVINTESGQFIVALNLGMKELAKLESVDAASAFRLYESYGLPFEVIKDKFPMLIREDFEREFAKHQDVSRAGAAKFTGGLADHEPETIKLHTAHHLLLAALQQVLGSEIKQRGSNITRERLRLDFSFARKLSPEELAMVEEMVNSKIKANLPVLRREMPRMEAENLGAEREFGGKYGEQVSVYFIGESEARAFSKEFCGGPHVLSTGEIGGLKILKEEAVAAGVRRIKAVLV